MVQAYVLIKVEAGSDAKVSADIVKLSQIIRATRALVKVSANIAKLSQIISASTTYGISDIIVEVDVPNIEELDDFVFDKIRKIPGVNETITLIKAKKIL